MKRYLTLLFLCCLVRQGLAQTENNTWVLGHGNAIDFSGGTATAVTTPATNGSSFRGASASVSDANGDLLFFTDGKTIWDKNFNVMPDGLLASASLGLASHDGVAVVPVPNKENLYYVFSLMDTWRQASWQNPLAFNSRLYYTLVDMSLNNGLGNVVIEKKWIELDEFMAAKMVAVKGEHCNSWLVVRAKKSNAYKAYEITRGGINPVPVVSNCGTFPLEAYVYGSLDVSPDGKKIAASLFDNSFNYGKGFGLELYDFDAATGQLSNAMVIDTGVNFPGMVEWSGISYTDVCFSPDNSKLYASCISGGRPFPPQFVFQFDVSQPTAQAIMASKTTVLFSQAGTWPNTGWINFYDLSLGNDGKVYCRTGAANQSVSGLPPLTVIHNPNLPGLLCSPVLHSFSFLNSQGIGNSMVSLPARLPERPDFTPDTLYHRIDTAFCASAVIDSAVLRARDTSGMNYVWDNGDTTAWRIIQKPGTYYVRYQRDACTDQVDTFQVQFHQYPAFTYDSIACYGMAGASLSPQDSSRFTYVWKNENGTVIDSTQSHTGSGLQGLNPGNYTLNITTPSGCDTTMTFTIEAWPQEVLTTDPQQATVKYGDSIQLHAFNYQLYTWWPSGSLDSATRPDPVARPFEPTTYTVIGLDENGCRDTGYVQIHIDYHLPTMVPNAFSPNGDGLNEVFKVEGITHQRLLEFRIFNRWGQEVFFTDQPEDGWDGTFKGKTCETDTYFYLIRLAQPPHQTKTLKGEVHLIR